MKSAPEIGQTVYLRSGSPKMTVVRQVDDKTVECVWTVFGTGVLQRAELPAAALKKAPVYKPVPREDGYLA
jgi:uncharacterized protein YodC (DUF2158 family)